VREVHTQEADREGKEKDASALARTARTASQGKEALPRRQGRIGRGGHIRERPGAAPSGGENAAHTGKAAALFVE